MSKYLRVGLLTALCSIGLASGVALAADAVAGQWTISDAATVGQVHLTLVRTTENSHFSSGSNWNIADLRGLDMAAPGKHDVRFAIVRDAGRFEGDGFVSGSQGAGLFTFTPAPGYAAALAAAGFPGMDDERQLSYALQDVSLAFAKEMKGLNLEHLDVERLIALRVHRIDAAYVNALRAQGIKVAGADNLIAFKVHGVTPEYVKSLHDLGFTPDDRQLVALRVHKITPEYIAGLKSHGLQRLTLDKIISFKIHGIT